MERLGLVEPPSSIESYQPKGFYSRRRLYDGLSTDEWVAILADRRMVVSWVVPWWDLGNVVDCNHTPHVRVASLSVLTFYLPARVRRQYGKEQSSDADIPTPTVKPLTKKNVQSWEEYWRLRTRVRVAAPTSDARFPRPIQSMVSSSMPANMSILDRLGPRKPTVWERLKGLGSSSKRDKRKR